MDIITELTKELKQIERAIQQLSRRHNGTTEQFGSICARTVRGYSQYCYRAPGETKSVYVSKGDVFKLKACAQADYENRTEKALLKQKRTIEQFLKHYEKNGINATYYRLCEGRKELVTPIEKTDEMYIEEWLRKHPGSQNTYTEGVFYTTKRGEKVRSKSELVIANMLYEREIPYQYESRVMLEDGRAVYPDFVALNVMKRKTLFWEHLGLLSEDDYAQKNFTKIIEYENAGILLGDGLIITMETYDHPLNIGTINKKIEMLLA